MDQTSDIVLFFGRFHPLIVHLPIGFLFFAFILELYSKWKNVPALMASIPLALLSGSISAFIACILGYLLSQSGDYNENTVDTHFWLGIATTCVTLIAWLIRIEKINIPRLQPIKANIATLALIIVLLSITGHYGGNLTHGNGYLTKYMPLGNTKKQKLTPVTKVEDAVVYSYLVAPILQDKCISCHNTDKKKGGLSLQDTLTILKGGKNGKILGGKNVKEPELTRRIFLNLHDDDVMPPEGKTPLTEEEKTIIAYWIDNVNADFNTTVADVETSEDIFNIASVMLGLKTSGKVKNMPLPTVNSIDKEVLDEIVKEGFKIRELVFESNLYEVILPSQYIKNVSDVQSKIAKLTKIKENILWLSLNDNLLTDSDLHIVSKFNNLQILKLNKNSITDKGIQFLKENKSISSLNLYETKITKNSLEVFSKMAGLKKVYVWKTFITKDDVTDYSTRKEYPEIIF